MVTRTVMVTPSEAAAFDAATTLSSSVAATSLSTSAAAAGSVVTCNAPPAEQKNTEKLQTNSFNSTSCTKRAQVPSPGGLVQLCRQKGCAVDFERGGSLCCIHQKGPTDGEESDSNDSADDEKIRAVTGDEGLCDRHSTHHGNNYCLDEVGKKRDRLSEDSISGKDDIKRQRVDASVLDLSDVPPQPPIPKSAGRIKEGFSKYKGVSVDKRRNKWQVQIYIDGKQRRIGRYENEEEAAIDYARAVFKYKSQGALDNAREQRARDTSRVGAFTFDLTGVPPQSPIPKSAGRIKEGASKYTGVCFNKQRNKWHAEISITGKNRYIGCYESEEEAAADYARAVFKHKGQGALDKAREQDSFIIDLSDVPPQSPIPNSELQIKEASSKYIGVTFNKQRNTWYARIMIEGKNRHIGCYESEEEAAVDYARAVFKYKGQGALDKARERRTRDKSGEGNSFIIDLSDVPPQPPIPKSAGRIKEGASKYTGVTFDKKASKWKAQINIDGKLRHIGSYENEEEAAADYARAVVKYKKQGALGTVREQNSIIDLSDVPPQPPIPKSAGHIKEGASKYEGVSFNKQMNKWTARIMIEGKNRHIGCYENEEEAAVDHARAVFKYTGQGALDKARERRARDKSGEGNSFIIDLS
eukprot:scaffold6614_cov106-Skeletonema_dohrnii-CCMP3373.AAC.1